MSEHSCRACTEIGRADTIGTELVTFPVRLFGFLPAGGVGPVTTGPGGLPYLGTGLAARRAQGATARFCPEHAARARDLAARRFTLRVALEELVAQDTS